MPTAEPPSTIAAGEVELLAVADGSASASSSSSTSSSTASRTPPKQRRRRSLCSIFRAQLRFACCTDVRITVFLLDVFLLGAGMSIVEGLLFLFFRTSLGASNSLLGLTVVMTCAFEIPLFKVGASLLRRFTPTQLMIGAHAAYVLRVFGYTFVPADMPGLVLLLEPCHGVTYALYQLTSVTTLGRLAPRGIENSVQGVRSTVSSLGALTGSIVGGAVLQHAGPEVLYRGAGVMVLLAGLAFWAVDRTQGGRTRAGARAGEAGAAAAAVMVHELLVDDDGETTN